MKKITYATLIFAATNIFFVANANADSFIEIFSRCSENNLSDKKAAARNAWATKCFPAEADKIKTRNKMTPRMYALVTDKKMTKWNAPTKKDASCKGWDRIVAFCAAACYAPEQEVLFADGYSRIDSAFSELKSDIVTLSKDADFANMSFNVLPVKEYTQSWRESSETLRIIRTKNGGYLRVTENHPLVLSTAIMTEASKIKAGQSLVRDDGSFDEVISNEKEEFFGRVYNVAPDSMHPIENIIVAQGFLNGSASYQYREMFKSNEYKKSLRKLVEIE